jgi:DNA-binding IclR family transcriptional regulator
MSDSLLDAAQNRIVALKAEKAKLSEMLKAEYQRAEAAERERDALAAELAEVRGEWMALSQELRNWHLHCYTEHRDAKNSGGSKHG